VDGKIIPRHTWDPEASPYSADVPLMVGTVLNEMTNSIQMGDSTLDLMGMDEVKKRLTAQRGAKGEALLAAYQKSYPNETPFDLFSRIGGMGARMNALEQAKRKAAQGGAPAYVYWFQGKRPSSIAVRAPTIVRSCRSSFTTPNAARL
jgi:para-nitrobenzyl esterase